MDAVRPRALRTAVAAAAALLLAAALSGCSIVADLVGLDDAQRDADTQQVTEAGDADVFTLRVGDCLMAQDGEEFSEAPLVPCDQAHDEEIFHEFELPDGDFPSDSAIDTAGEDACIPAFEDFVGIGYDDSTLDWYTITPTESGWKTLHDRKVQCVVYDPEGQVTGSLENARR